MSDSGVVNEKIEQVAMPMPDLKTLARLFVDARATSTLNVLQEFRQMLSSEWQPLITMVVFGGNTRRDRWRKGAQRDGILPE